MVARLPLQIPGSWVEPGPEQGPFTTTLNDGSTVTFLLV